MSYILDALRKSETERRQGQVPDLGQQVQLIHRPRKRRGLSAAAWVALALLVNAVVIAVLFWPEQDPTTARTGVDIETPVAAPARLDTTPSGPDETTEALDQTSPEMPVLQTGEMEEADPQVVPTPEVSEKPTIIVPSASIGDDNPVLPEPETSGRVPHLVELPLSFQKSIPDLTFNSHLYSSDPSSSRVMINDNYLRAGDQFSGLRIERITEDGVVLSKQGQSFRVGTVRDWVSPR